MMEEEQPTENLFSYGTLRSEPVQLATFGRKVDGHVDALVGYKVVVIEIDDPDFVAASGTAQHRNLQFTGVPSDVVEGMVFFLTMKENRTCRFV